MRQRPTLPPLKAVPSARPGLTSLFGMGRGGPRCYNHLNVFYHLPFVRRMGLTLAKRNKLPYPLPDTLSLSRVRASIGLLVLLGFAVADFTPAAYQRHRL